MNNDISISETELNNIINDMNSESLEISKCLENISDLFDSLDFEGEVGDSIRVKTNAIKASFPTIKANIESYITDFQNLITTFNDNNSSVSMGDVDLAKGGETVNVKN